ncbi:unnamed protein product [Cylicostephanus goldi]|uniref:Uncharacterized protein n=1 Tax=Cylicostephanus goldi TaxID=71465 RepID=A0A3P7MWN7_CYLGO|nr:unnamed protein product [Cylicostephanus goldi]
MPVGAMIGAKILCLPGGPGPTIREHGLAALRSCSRTGMSQLDKLLCMVDEGFLNYPKEALTITSAVAYLDNFRNCAAAVTFQGLNASVVRYRMDEGEPKSLDIVKPGIGRNAMAYPV